MRAERKRPQEHECPRTRPHATSPGDALFESTKAPAILELLPRSGDVVGAKKAEVERRHDLAKHALGENRMGSFEMVPFANVMRKHCR